MKHFSIDAENNITVHATRKEARETIGGVFATEEQFANLIGDDTKRLIEIWNSLPNVSWNGLPGFRSVIKFTNRKTATGRIWKAIQSLEVTQAVVTDPVMPHAPDVGTVGATLDNEASPATEAATAAKTPKTREGSKTSRVIELLKREGGVTLKEIMIEMGWQAHTTRALLSAGGNLTKKHGIAIVSTKGKDGDRVYTIGV